MADLCASSVEALALKLQTDTALSTMHITLVVIAVAAAVIFLLAYRKFTEGGMSDCVRWATFGVMVLAAAQVLDNLGLYQPEYSLQLVYATHFVEIIGFSCLGFAAWEIYRFSRKLG